MIAYEIRGYLFRPEGNTMDLKFFCKVPSLEDCIMFLSAVHFDEYDRVTVLPEDYQNKEN